MSEILRPHPANQDFLGITQAELDPDSVYTQLADLILTWKRRTGISPEKASLAGTQQQEQTGKLKIISHAGKAALVELDKKIKDRYKYLQYYDDENIELPEHLKPPTDLVYIFDNQAHADQIFTQGLSALTEAQARQALKLVTFEVDAIKVYEELLQLAQQKIESAKTSKNIQQYLQWWSYRRQISVEWIRYAAEYSNTDPDIMLSSNELVTILEENTPHWQAEAKMFKKLAKLISALPDDPTKPKIATMRMPKEADPKRSVRTLIVFPPHTFRDNGGQYVTPDPDQQAFYSGHDNAPECVQDAYDKLYRLMRQESAGGDMVARAAYLTPYQAENHEQIADFPEEAERIIELSFHDDPTVLPITRQVLTSQHPELTYHQKPSIDHQDLYINYSSPDGVEHFIMGYDRHGLPIRQDTIKYSLNVLMSHMSNVTNTPVAELLSWIYD